MAGTLSLSSLLLPHNQLSSVHGSLLLPTRTLYSSKKGVKLGFLQPPIRMLRRRASSLYYLSADKLLIRKSSSGKISAKFDLKPPPYPLNALEPHMSQRTLEYHWGKHHRTYVDNLNKQIAGTELGELSLEDIVVATYNKGDLLPPFNNAAQVWNHDFFWESMKPGGGGTPTGHLLALIERDFGSFEKFIEDFKTAAATQFGSGWAWLAYKEQKLDVGNAINPSPSEEDKKLVIVKTPNAVNPLVLGYHSLLTIDVWEHAYYLDVQNLRPSYISTFVTELISWEAVSSRLETAVLTVGK